MRTQPSCSRSDGESVIPKTPPHGDRGYSRYILDVSFSVPPSVGRVHDAEDSGQQIIARKYDSQGCPDRGLGGAVRGIRRGLCSHDWADRCYWRQVHVLRVSPSVL